MRGRAEQRQPQADGTAGMEVSRRRGVRGRAEKRLGWGRVGPSHHSPVIILRLVFV